MKMKTSELSSAALDWAVAKCEVFNKDCGLILIGTQVFETQWNSGERKLFCPSTDWAQGGPIIEREINKIWKNVRKTYGAQIKIRIPYYSPTYDADIGADAFISANGATPLIAAMRCYVASKLGIEIEIPEELT